LKRSVKVLDAAAEEAAESAAWYERQREGLGFEFQEAIDAALDLLEDEVAPLTPVPGFAGKRGAKRLILKRFPYSIVVREQGFEPQGFGGSVSIAKKDLEPGLGEVTVCRKGVLDTQVGGNEDTDAICQAPILVGALTKQVKSAIKQRFIDGQTLPTRRAMCGLDQSKRDSLEWRTAEGVAHLHQHRVRGHETAAGERELAAHRHSAVVPIILLVAEGDEGCRVDEDSAHSQGAQVVIVALGKISDAGVHRHRIDRL
jgi:hypothetical protein